MAKKVRLKVTINDEILREAKEIAKKEGTSLSQIVNDRLIPFLKEQKKREKEKKNQEDSGEK